MGWILLQNLPGRKRSLRRGSSGRVCNKSSSISITVDSKETFVERLRSQKRTRDKRSNYDETVRELEPSKYLLKKFLKPQILMIESFQDSYFPQVQHIEEPIIGEWQEFHTRSVTDASESWSSMSQSIGDSDAQVSEHEIV